MELEENSVAAYDTIQAAHVARCLPVRLCNDPDVFLDEAIDTLFPCCNFESAEAYANRLSRVGSAFENHYTKLRDLIVGAALRHPSSPPQSLTPEWENFLANVSLNSENLDAFLRRVLLDAIDGGYAGILVDHPETTPGLTVAEEKALALRPYFLPIKAQDILAFRTLVESEQIGQNTVYGVKITHLRIRETITEIDPDDEFKNLVIPAVSVYDLENGVVRYRQFVLREDKFIPENDSFLSIPLIPFVPVYGAMPSAHMQCKPLLLDIARLNLNHWQTSADLAHLLSLTAMPIFTISGVQGTEPVRTDRALFLEDSAASAAWQAAPVDGAQALMDRLEDLKEAMQTLATVTLAQKSNGVESAQSKLLDSVQSDSLVSVIVGQLEDSANKALQIAALFRGWEPINITLSRDFSDLGMQAADVTALANVHAAGGISHRTFLETLERGEVFQGIENWSVDEELKRCEEEQGEISKRSAAGLAPTPDPDLLLTTESEVA